MARLRTFVMLVSSSVPACTQLIASADHKLPYAGWLTCEGGSAGGKPQKLF